MIGGMRQVRAFGHTESSEADMEQVALNRRGMSGTVVSWMETPGFPEHLYISLENSVGFGEASGGLGVGSVIDPVAGMESGFFGATARIDELVLNIPDQQELRRFFSQGDGESGTVAMTPSMKRQLADSYEWVFADRVNGTRIRWE